MPRVTAVPSSDRVVTLRDGRSLGYAEWGDLDGWPVALFHGMPGSRLLCPDADATEAFGVRLITIDRPGYGRSDPLPERTLLSWADDYAEFHDLLGLPPCPIVGWSGGGPHALACAVRTPDLVSSVVLAASAGPLDEIPGACDELTPEDRDFIELLRRDRSAASERLTIDRQWYADFPASAFEKLPADPRTPDGALLAQADVREAFFQSHIDEGARQGAAGWVADSIACSEPWGFSVADVTQDVGVWAGERDELAIRRAAEYFDTTIPQATLFLYSREGHFVHLLRWLEMLAWLDRVQRFSRAGRPKSRVDSGLAAVLSRDLTGASTGLQPKHRSDPCRAWAPARTVRGSRVRARDRSVR